MIVFRPQKKSKRSIILAIIGGAIFFILFMYKFVF